VLLDSGDFAAESGSTRSLSVEIEVLRWLRATSKSVCTIGLDFVVKVDA